MIILCSKGSAMRSLPVSCPAIGKHRIQRDDTNKHLLIDHVLIQFTSKEYRILVCFLNDNVVSDTYLIHDVLQGEDTPALRQMIDKYIDKLRWKLRPFGLNIYRITKYGYILLLAVD